MRLIAAAFAVLVSAIATPEDKQFEGYVTDDMCGAEHMMEGMNDKECAKECVKMGSAYALYVPAEEKMYLADDPTKLEPYAGENVVVKATVSADGKTLRITEVKKAKTS